MSSLYTIGQRFSAVGAVGGEAASDRVEEPPFGLPIATKVGPFLATVG